MKRFLIPLLVFALLFTLSACGERVPETTEEPEVFDYKIGIVTGSEAKGTEEYKAALLMQEKYGDRIVLSTLPDDLLPRDEWTIDAVKELAADETVKAIVIVRAVPGMAYTIEKIRKERSDIIFICGDCVESPEIIASAADICLAVNPTATGEGAVTQAKAMGAKTLVHISSARQLKYEPVKTRRDAIQKKCKSAKIKFVEVVSPDPLESGGEEAVVAWMHENIPALVEKYGVNTALFAAGAGMQTNLIRNATYLGAIVPMTGSSYHYAEAFGLFNIPEETEETEIPETTEETVPTGNTDNPENPVETETEETEEEIEEALSYDDLPAVVGKITETVAEAENTGRMSDLAVPMNTIMVKAGVEYAVKWCEHQMKADAGSTLCEKTLSEELKALGGEDMEIKKYEKSSKGTLDNYFMLSCGFTTF